MKERSLKPLIAVVTCHKRRDWADAQRDTWLPFAGTTDVRFFVGNGGSAARSGEVLLDAPDDYQSLPYKTRAAFQWALDHGYDYVFKTDDDVYIQPARLLQSLKRFDWRDDYVGPLRGPSGNFYAPYASGFAYWVSRRAMEILVKSKIRDWAEDRWVGNSLSQWGIACHPDYRYTIVRSRRNKISGTEGPRVGNDIIAVGELDPGAMRLVHAAWLSRPSVIAPGGMRDKASIVTRECIRRVRAAVSA